MASSGDQEDEREEICYHVAYVIRAKYLRSIQRQLMLLTDGNSVHENMRRYNSVLEHRTVVMRSLEKRNGYVRLNLEEAILCALDANVPKDSDQHLSFDTYKGMIPKLLEDIKVECDKVKDMFSEAYLLEQKARLEKELDRLAEEIERGKLDPEYLEVDALTKKIFGLESNNYDDQIDDILKFMNETEPDIYQKYLEVYAYYQQPGVKDEFTTCPNCEQGVSVDRLLRYNQMEHLIYTKKKKKFTCEEAFERPSRSGAKSKPQKAPRKRK